MLLCDDVRPHPTNPRKVSVYGLINEIRAVGAEAAYPLTHSFSVYLALTAGRGTGEGQIVVASADTGGLVYVGGSHSIVFDPDPLKVKGVIFRITSCSFPQPGLYWVEFRYNGDVIARQPLQVR
jgi:hypothetical protein